MVEGLRVNTSAADKALEEVAKYKHAALLPLSEDLLKCWSMHERESTHFCPFRQNATRVPGTSTPAERIFFTVGDIVTAHSCLLPENVDQLYKKIYSIQ